MYPSFPLAEIFSRDQSGLERTRGETLSLQSTPKQNLKSHRGKKKFTVALSCSVMKSSEDFLMFKT